MDIDWGNPSSAIALLGRQVGLWRWEFASNHVQWSDHLLEMLGLRREDFGETFEAFEALLHPQDRPLIETRISEHLATGKAYRFRCRLRHTSGGYLTTLAQGTTIRDADGQPAEMIGTVIDVTSEVEATAQLVESERSFRSMAENVPGAIFRYLLRPDGSDAIEYMSSGCYSIWELTAEEIKGDPAALWAVVFEDDLPEMQASVQQSAEDLAYWHHRWRIRTRSGQVKYLDGRGSPVRLADGSTLWNSLVLDMTQEQAIRDALIQNQQMLGQAQKLEAIGRISGGIAHDFNNLLAIVMGNAELCGVADSHHDQAVFVREIVDACKRGSELTRRLLSFARRATLHPEVIDVHTALTQFGRLVARVIPENIRIEMAHDPGLWHVSADPAFLESSILNLCINARDAMPEGGALTLEARNIEVTTDYIAARQEEIPPGRYVMIAVTDTGVGIPPDAIEKVTEPFYSTKGPDLGSGLGLAMVDGFVRQSDGTLLIYSEVSVGTTIKLFLPSAERPEQRTGGLSPGDRRDPARHAGRILIVEDEPAILRMLESTLSDAGYSTATATDGDSALARFGHEASDFDILLTDVVMPGTHQGPLLAKRLTALNPSLKTVFMSGYPNEAAVHGNGLRPEDRFLMKPVRRDHLLQTLVAVSLDDGSHPNAGDGPA